MTGINGPRRSRPVVTGTWTVSCDVADPLPGVTEGGANVAVAPAGSPLTENVTGDENVPFCAATMIPYCAVPPRVAVCAVVDTESVNVAAPAAVPVRLAVCGDPAPLSATLTFAVSDPADPGVNVTEMVQLEPAATDAPQLLVCAKLLAFVPVIVILVIVSAAVPVLDSVNGFAALVVPTV